MNTDYDELSFTTGQLDLRMIALSRLMLDNFPHIKAFWIMIGEKIAQLALSFGADDMDGTVVEEKITHAAGAETAQTMAAKKIENLIREAGRRPVERDTVYRRVGA
jgi:aminodeoxyfutalosine synthase